jgi:tetratricopeptide (TPR) repeat protein
MAMTYIIMPGYLGDPSDTLTSLGVVAARRALALDASNVDARLALAYAELHDSSPEKSEPLFAAVLKDAPDYATAHQWYGTNLTQLGRYDEAVVEYERAAAIDPLSAVVPDNLAYTLATAGRLPEAVRALRRALELDPHFGDASALSVYVLNGQADSALAHLNSIQRADSTTLALRGLTAIAYAAKGNWAQVDSIRKVAERYPAGSAPVDAALIALATGDAVPLSRLIKTSAGRNQWFQAFISLRCSPLLAPLRSDASLTSIVGSNCPAIPWPIKPRPLR